MMLENASRKLGRFINWSSFASLAELVKHIDINHSSEHTAFLQVNVNE